MFIFVVFRIGRSVGRNPDGLNELEGCWTGDDVGLMMPMTFLDGFLTSLGVDGTALEGAD
jgi:hypothetical protein